jgi:hypothetical protein
MKIVKGLAILVVLTSLFGSCFDPPEFPNQPDISFIDGDIRKNFQYYAPDSLVMHISFKDGDGDLGIDPSDPKFINDPYHYRHYFLANNGNLDSVSTILENDSILVLQIPNPIPANVKLATIRTRNNTLYNDAWEGGPIPSIPPSSHCDRYPYQIAGKQTRNFVYVEAQDTAVLESSTANLRKISAGGTTYYAVEDTLLVKYNQNYYNLDAELYTYNPSHPKADEDGFAPYDWAKLRCSTIDGRFPFLSDTEKTLEGDLTYGVKTTGLNDFLGQPIKFSIQITDRALNKSDLLKTRQPFTLDHIRK